MYFHFRGPSINQPTCPVSCSASQRLPMATAREGLSASKSKSRFGIRSLLSPRGSQTERPAPQSSVSEQLQPSNAIQPDGSFICQLGQLSPTEVELARENFRKFDADGDGMISRHDFGMAMARHDQSWLSPHKKCPPPSCTRHAHTTSLPLQCP